MRQPILPIATLLCLIGASTVTQSAAAPAGQRHVVDAAGQEVTLHCDPGDTVEISAADVRATISGACAALFVHGADTEVDIESVGDISIEGADAHVYWLNPIDGRAPRIVRISGAGSFVRGKRGTAGVPTVTDRAAQSASASRSTQRDATSGRGPKLVGSNGEFEHVCNGGETVELVGSSNHMTLRGDCGALNLFGSDNVVEAETLSAANVTGSGNQVSWSRGARPTLNQNGADNRLLQRD